MTRRLTTNPLYFQILFLLSGLFAMGQDRIIDFKSNFIGQRKIRIYLPEDYDEAKRRYPVIYMNDAQNLFDAKTSYAGEWRIDETLDSLNAQVIVVGIDHGNEKRLSELTPFANPEHGGGQGAKYVNFLIDELMPRINRDYRTRRSRKHTAIGGSSLGALISWYAVLEHPRKFGKAILFSPSLWYTDDIFRITEKQKRIRTKTYILAGDSESKGMVPDVERLVDLLSARMRPSDYKLTVVKGGQHNEKLWATSFAKAYLWVFEKRRKSTRGAAELYGATAE